METLRELRRRKGLSQKDLAELAGVGQDTISGIESGRHEARPSTIRKLASALGVEVEDFFRETEAPKGLAPKSSGPATRVLTGGGIQSSVTLGGGDIYERPTEAQWAEFARQVEELQHDIDAGETSKGAAWDAMVGTVASFKRRD